jgi:hypothetical protein
LVHVPDTSQAAGLVDIPRREVSLLGHGSPTPFAYTAEMKLDVPRASDILVEVFDVHGRLQAVLADGRMPSGIHSLAWNGLDREGRAAPSGVYFVKLRAGESQQTRRLVLLK